MKKETNIGYTNIKSLYNLLPFMHYQKLLLTTTYYITKYFYTSPIIKIVFMFCFTLFLKNALDLSNYTFCMEDVSPDAKILRSTRSYKQLPINYSHEEKESNMTNIDSTSLDSTLNHTIEQTTTRVPKKRVTILTSDDMEYANYLRRELKNTHKYISRLRTEHILLQEKNTILQENLAYNEEIIETMRKSISALQSKVRRYESLISLTRHK